MLLCLSRTVVRTIFCGAADLTRVYNARSRRRKQLIQVLSELACDYVPSRGAGGLGHTDLNDGPLVERAPARPLGSARGRERRNDCRRCTRMPTISKSRFQTRIDNRIPDGEMVHHLPVLGRQIEIAVHLVIVERADASCS